MVSKRCFNLNEKENSVCFLNRQSPPMTKIASKNKFYTERTKNTYKKRRRNTRLNSAKTTPKQAVAHIERNANLPMGSLS